MCKYIFKKREWKEENVEMLKCAGKKRKKKQRSKSEWLPQIDFDLWEFKEECECWCGAGETLGGDSTHVLGNFSVIKPVVKIFFARKSQNHSTKPRQKYFF